MGSVIRRENAPPLSAYAFQDVERQAHEILAAARAQAEQILADAGRRVAGVDAQARQKAEALHREAHAGGLAQGQAEGRAAGREEAKQEARQAAIAAAQAELAHLTQSLTVGLADFEQNKQGLLAVAESGLIELAVAVARRVCKTVVATSVEPALANSRALLELVQHGNDLTLCFHPAEHDLLSEVAPEFLAATGKREHLSLVADPMVPRGGCVLRTTAGVVDAAIEGQLDRIAAAICAARDDRLETGPTQDDRLETGPTDECRGSGGRRDR